MHEKAAESLSAHFITEASRKEIVFVKDVATYVFRFPILNGMTKTTRLSGIALHHGSKSLLRRNPSRLNPLHGLFEVGKFDARPSFERKRSSERFCVFFQKLHECFFRRLNGGRIRFLRSGQRKKREQAKEAKRLSMFHHFREGVYGGCMDEDVGSLFFEHSGRRLLPPSTSGYATILYHAGRCNARYFGREGRERGATSRAPRPPSCGLCPRAARFPLQRLGEANGR